MPRERVFHIATWKQLFVTASKKKKKILPVLSLLQNFSKKTITLPVSADTSTNSGNLAVVFWNILLEQICSLCSRWHFFNLKIQFQLQYVVYYIV